MAVNNINENTTAKTLTEKLFWKLLSSTHYVNDVLVSSMLTVFHILDKDLDCAGIDVLAISKEATLSYRYDVKHRTLNTGYTNFSVGVKCIDRLMKRRDNMYVDQCGNSSSHDEYSRFYFAFALDDGEKYTGEYLVVQGYDLLNHIDECEKLQKPNNSNEDDEEQEFYLVPEKMIRQLTTTSIYKPYYFKRDYKSI
jgi:hypothetical protein